MTMTSEDVARKLATAMRARPISEYDLPRPPALPAQTSGDSAEEYDFDDDPR